MSSFEVSLDQDPLRLDADDVRATRRPLERARTLPGRFYVEPAIFGVEIERIFSRRWVAAGREEDLPEPGSFLVRELGGESLLLARGEDGRARAFYNVCRHRGTRLVEEPCGRRSRFRCPYHSWTYAPDGRLLNAPLMESHPDFEADDLPLRPVRLESWHGFLFLHLDPHASPLAEQLADLPDLERWSLADLRRVERHEYDVEANWKVLSENYGECYHCALVHPQLHRISHYLSGGDQEQGHSFVGGPMTLNEGFDTMTHSGHSDRASLPGLSADDSDKVLYYDVYPNLLLSLHRDYVMTHTLWPRSPGRTRIVCEWLFHPDAIAAEGFDPGDAVAFWDETNRQDWQICEKTQLGVASRGYVPGPFQAGEGCVHAFDNWYLDQLGAPR